MKEQTLSLHINGQIHTTTAPSDMPLLWVLREKLNLTGTKFGCGIAQCGVCTVLVEGVPTRACVTPASAVADKPITTIEGLARGDTLHPVQQSWLEHDVPQCGYCQSGQILNAVALLESNPRPSEDEVTQAMSGMICRCGTYGAIRTAILAAAQRIREQEHVLQR